MQFLQAYFQIQPNSHHPCFGDENSFCAANSPFYQQPIAFKELHIFSDPGKQSSKFQIIVAGKVLNNLI
jgi:hypothetical protein